MSDCCPPPNDPMHSNLPLELCYLIIEFVAAAESYGEITLSSCALVCRAWLSFARSHLFRSIGLHSFREYDRLLESFRTSPHLAYHIRALHFKIHSMSGDGGRTLPISIFAKLPALESISYCSSLTAQTLRLRESLARLPPIPSVTAFTVHTCVFGKFSDLALLLRAFPNLRKLRLFKVIFMEHDIPGPNDRPPSPLSLRSLSLQSMNAAEPVFAWLASSSSRSSLRNVSVWLDVKGSLSALYQFLGTCGLSVKHLSVRIRVETPLWSTGHDDPQLAQCCKLHSFSIHIRDMTELHTLPRLLSTIPSSLLSKITVRLDPSPSIADATTRILQTFDQRPEDCASFDRAFMSDRFPALQSIVFAVPPALQPQLVRSLGQAMPLTARKMLFL